MAPASLFPPCSFVILLLLQGLMTVVSHILDVGVSPPWGAEEETAAWIMEIWIDLKRDLWKRMGLKEQLGKTDEKMMEYDLKMII